MSDKVSAETLVRAIKTSADEVIKLAMGLGLGAVMASDSDHELYAIHYIACFVDLPEEQKETRHERQANGNV